MTGSGGVLAYRVLDLFSGAGGMALGFKAAGARCVGGVEVSRAAAETFLSEFGQEAVVFNGAPRPIDDGKKPAPLPHETVEGNTIQGWGDVNHLPIELLLNVLPEPPDLVVGGPPCQGFSPVGTGRKRGLGITDSTRNQLYQYFLEVVRQAQPLAFVMENVPGMRKGEIDFARRIAREANYVGYNVRYFMLSAASYGVPQHRWRLFFVGLRSDLGHDAIPHPPCRTHLSGSPPEGSSLPSDPWLIAGDDLPIVSDPLPAVSVSQAIGDLPSLKGHLDGRIPSGDRMPLRAGRTPSAYVGRLREWPGMAAAETVSGNWYRYTPRDFETFRRMAHGDQYPEALAIAHLRLREDLAALATPPAPGTAEWEALKEKVVPPYRNDIFDDKWHKLTPSQPSWTVPAHLSKDGYSHIHYDSRQARTVTIREAARIQSFPDALDFCGNYGDQFRQIGNAVPPLLARAIATSLFAQLDALLERKNSPKVAVGDVG